jgi:FtsZ-binding cell division protein ZapB
MRMFKSLMNLVDGNEVEIKSGRDAMSEETLQVMDKLEEKLKEKDEAMKKLQSDFDSLKAGYETLMSTAKGIEAERNGIIVSLRVFTETALNTVKTQTA